MNMHEFAPKVEVMRSIGGDIISAEDSAMRHRPTLIQKWKEHYNTPIYQAPRSNNVENGCIIFFMANIFGIFYVTAKTYGGSYYYLLLLLQFYLMVQTFTSWVRVRKEAKNNVCDETISRNKISINYATQGHKDPSIPNPMLWKYCEICKLDVPPRSHHCKVCQNCVLKRGHHCYLTDVCVGYHNQRHFMKMCLFSVIYGCFGLSIAYDYLSTSSEGEWYDFILPLALCRFFTGYLELHRLLAVLTAVYTLWWVVPVSGGLLTSHVIAMMEGRTQHESKFDAPVQTNVSRGQRLRAVLGERWLRGLLLPGNRGWTPLAGDGVVWSDLVLQYNNAKSDLPMFSNVQPESMSMDHI